MEVSFFQNTSPRRTMGTSTESRITTYRWSVKAAATVSTPILLSLSSFAVNIQSFIDIPIGSSAWKQSWNSRHATCHVVQKREVVRRAPYYSWSAKCCLSEHTVKVSSDDHIGWGDPQRLGEFIVVETLSLL